MLGTMPGHVRGRNTSAFICWWAMSHRLAIVTSHLIQYHAQWFRRLASDPRLDVEVLYCHRTTTAEQGAAGFGAGFEWDVPLLDGYRSVFVPNVSRQPSVHRFGGLDTPLVADLIRAGRFDAVLVNGWAYKSFWQAIWACWRAGIPVMVRSDSHLRTHRSAAKSLVKWPLYRSLIPRFDACLAVGSLSSEYFRQYGAKEDRIFSVPHTVDYGLFTDNHQGAASEAGRLRQEWGFTHADVVFLFVGKFIPGKRPLDFIAAVSRAAPSGSRIVGLMVGDGPLRSQCEALVDRSKAPVTFAGFLNQSAIVRAYVASDVLVLPSDGGETWGLAVNEAMACGRPCIVSDGVGAGPDLVIPGETGEVYPMGDVASLARTMARLSEDRDHLIHLGTAGRERERVFALDTSVEGVVRAIECVRASRAAGAHVGAAS